MVQKCYIDESYDQKTFVLSCSVGRSVQWTHFERAWAGALNKVNLKLRKEGRKEISRYHASDCAGFGNEFKGWNVEEQKALTASLIEALRLVPMHSVAYTVFLDDLRSLWRERFRINIHRENLYEAAYFLTMQHCMMELGGYLYSLNPYLRMTVIHDHSDYDGMMLNAFNYIKYTLNPPYAKVLSTIAPMSSKECLPLQLADFLAYEFFKDRSGEQHKGKSYNRRKSFALTLQTGTGVRLSTLPKDWIRKIMDAGIEVNGIAQNPD